MMSFGVGVKFSQDVDMQETLIADNVPYNSREMR